MQFILVRKAKNCMDNLNEKDIILMVDDDPVVLDVGTIMIQRSGCKVLQATNGMEAIQVFKDYIDDISLVILDEKLPDELGSDTCKKLKEFKSDVKVRNRQFNPIFTKPVGYAMMSPKDKEARSWISYREPRSWSKNAATGNSRLSSGNRPV
jgi:CheY-like chemotaxis protein